MRYGNTAQQLRRGVQVGLIIGALGYTLSAALFVFYEQLPVERLIPFMFILVVPAIVIGLGIAPTLLFSIHIVGEWVEHRLLDRWVLSRAKVSEFISMRSPAGFFGAVLQFEDGTKMRFFGAHLGILATLDAELRRRATRQNDSSLTNTSPV